MSPLQYAQIVFDVGSNTQGWTDRRCIFSLSHHELRKFLSFFMIPKNI